MTSRVLITGSSGLIGSEAVQYYDDMGWAVVGVDNNMREVFFGPEGSTEWNKTLLLHRFHNFAHYNIDIRDADAVNDLFQLFRPFTQVGSQPLA